MRKRKGALLLAAALCLQLAACAPASDQEETEQTGLKVVSTVFPGYDFARAVCGEGGSVMLLLPPGAESHSYEPTPADILAVQESDLFIYVGGESDVWVETLLESAEPTGRQLRMMDCVETLEEETVEGMTVNGHDHEDDDHGLGEVVDIDEHVWTSPQNAALITQAVADAAAELAPEQAETYQANAQSYIQELNDLDQDFADFFATLESPTLVFGDRFPLRYFAEEYGLRYYAAFPGCSAQTEPSAATIAFLTDLVEEEEIYTVYYIEFSNHLVADSIAEATGVQTAEFQTCHNVTQKQLDAGATYVSLMRENLEMLRQTMQ